MGCRAGTVKSRLSRALARLRVRLATEVESDAPGGTGSAGDFGEVSHG